MQYKCLSIAGFDGSGGAGMQADLKTFSALGCYGMTVLTALPVQNTCGVKTCYPIPLQAIEEQLDAIFSDIIPDSIKIGMLYSAPIITIIAKYLKQYPNIPIILDPVMTAKNGNLLLQPEAIRILREQLIPLATLITPNLPEAYALVGKNESMPELLVQLMSLKSHAVLLKGGHGKERHSNDLFIEKNGLPITLKAKRIESNNTHGTGCTLSAAIAAFVARGVPLSRACQFAKKYLYNAILHAKNQSLGHGHGPVHHFYNVWNTNQHAIPRPGCFQHND